jgi:PAS domain S-box-containing protein
LKPPALSWAEKLEITATQALLVSDLNPDGAQTLIHEPNKPSGDRLDKTAKPVFDPRAHLAAIIDSSDDAIISKDLNGTILSWNEAAARIFGYSADEIVGQSILTLIPPELRQEEDKILAKVKAGERIHHYETTRVRKNGEKFPISATISPIRNETGTIVGASKVARDISDRTRNDQSRFQLAAIVDTADDAIVSKDLNGIVKTWNQGAVRMFGYTPEEMVGKPILRLIPEELHYEEDEILRKLRIGERIDHYNTVRMKKSGERIEVSVTISPIRDASGRVIGASKIARDISDRRRIERLLVQSEKLAATGRMAAAIAHEINNPLEALVNLIFLAKKNSPPEGKAYAHLQTAEQELERVAHIARQTLGYYRDTGQPTELHLHELIENVLAVYKAKCVASLISVEANFNDIQKISVSRGELLQVFSNIITNAIDAMQGGGNLSIATRKIAGSTGEGIQVIIRDNGVGILQEHLDKIFEPFFTTKGNLGTGIGLWIARQLAERRGGQISIASSAEKGNSGTTVTIFIPFAVPAPQPSSVEQ